MAIHEDLPFEVLSLCFVPLPLRDRVVASHVCQRWRTAAVTSPELWSALCFDHKLEQREVFLSILERSGAGQLDATWRFQRGAVGSDLLAANMWRVRGLSFILHDHDPDFGDVPEGLLVCRAPVLERLHFDGSGRFTIPAGWDDRGAPRLRELSVSSFAFDPQCRRFGALRRFRGVLPAGWDAHMRLHGLFQLCPGLVELELGGFNTLNQHLLPHGPMPPTLSRLVFLDRTYSIDYGPLLESLMGLPQSVKLPGAIDFYPALKLFDARVDSPFTLTCHTIPAVFEDGAEHPGKLSIRMQDGLSYTLTTIVGNLRVALDCVARATPYLRNVGTLTCPAEFFDRLLKLQPTLPALQSLTIAVGGKRPFGDLNYCHFQRSGHVVVPQLRTLFIDTTAIDRDFAASARDWFLRTLPRTLRAWLHVGQPKLAALHLFLREDLVSTSVSVSLAALLPCAETVFVGWRDGWEHGIEGRGEWYPAPAA